MLRIYIGDSPTRALVCGIIWLDNGFAINTHQLSLVSNRSKSSINASMQALGYGTVPSGADVAPQIEQAFPCLRGQSADLRQWTIRRKMDEMPPPGTLSQEPLVGPESTLLDDECVAAYLNDECSLSQMVQGLLQTPGNLTAGTQTGITAGTARSWIWPNLPK
jgi:hypothetical protein